ncbi:DUF4123 domain-containing protein [Pseudomonas sp. GD03860]|uniref:DUF4123 domain-containing protein n=1 Tax=Pseudomonas TaxID=286 RepID=UPI0023644F71|nr:MULTISPECIES: DUF4123 domain-containing protein [Pseudomonas]MDD2058470.1 DUF4123 domain-containing protein [Pseudomonas putida]MDH0640429.1 DUF4123 domain-containing protein [Pseudomonas sp. GD03860]
MSSVSSANYLLIDGVLRPDALSALYQRTEVLEIEPLYLKTRWAPLHDLGPILVSIHGSANLVDETLDNATRQADASLLHSDASMSNVADHLRRFIDPPDVLGGNGLLRFADPLVTHHWLDSYQGAHLDAVLGPISTWHVPQSPHAWERSELPVWRSFARQAAQPGWVDSLGRLGEGQLSALDQAARWKLIEQLYRSLEKDHPRHLARVDKGQLNRWFNERLDQAQAWGLGSERSVAIWVEFSLRWGDDFTSRLDAPYQQWLARTPDAHRLATELRIQQMERDGLALELNEDA